MVVCYVCLEDRKTEGAAENYDDCLQSAFPVVWCSLSIAGTLVRIIF